MERKLNLCSCAFRVLHHVSGSVRAREMNMEKQKPIEFMTSQEAAERLGVTEARLCQMRRTGGGPDWFRFGLQTVVYLEKDVAEFQESGGAS